MTATAVRARPLPGTEAPGPAGRPLLGMAGALRRDLLGTLLDGFARHGDVVLYRVGPARGPRRLRRLVVALHHPDDVRRVFADEDAFARRTSSFGVLRELFGVNLVTADGEDWRRQKRLLQPLFTRTATQRYAALVEEEARAVAEDVQARPGAPIDALRTAEPITHRHPDFWSDPEAFDPWRFVGEQARPPYAWFPSAAARAAASAGSSRCWSRRRSCGRCSTAAGSSHSAQACR